MDKLFELIKDDINYIKFTEEEKEDFVFSDFVNVSLSESRINKLYKLIENYYLKNNLGEAPKFRLNRENELDYELQKINNVLNEVEEKIDDVKDIINEVNEINKTDLFLEADISKDNITKEDLVKQFDGLVHSLEIAIKNNRNENNKTVSMAELLNSFKSQVVRVMTRGQTSNVLSFDTPEYKKMNEYVEDVNKAFIKYNSKIFEENKNDNNEEINNLPNENILEGKANENEDEILDKLNFDEIEDSKDLAPKIRELVRTYINKRYDYIQVHGEAEFYPLGKFLFDLKDKITEELPDSEIYLGKDKDSTFIKNFLHNPVDGMVKYIDEKIKYYDEKDLLKNPFFEEDEKVDYNKLINNQNRFKNIILNEKDNYDKYKKNKIDEWAIRQDKNSKRFEQYFKYQLKNKIPEALVNNKGGFFENLFGTTSKEYKEFSKSLENMVKDGPEKGDLDGLREKAEAYLIHKLKNYDSITNNVSEDINKLDNTSKGRVRLCLSVIESIDFAKKSAYRDLNPYNEEFGVDVFKNITDLNKKFDELDNFQNNLKEDSEIDKNNNIIDNELGNDNNIIKEDIEK